MSKKTTGATAEREAIKRENDQPKLEQLSKEIAELKEQESSYKAKWEAERGLVNKIQHNKQQIEQLKFEAERAEREGDYGKVAEIRYGKLKALEDEINRIQDQLKDTQGGDAMIKEEVTSEDIADVVSRWTGIPVSKMLQSEREKLLHLEEELHKRVIGQDEAKKILAVAVHNHYCRPDVDESGVIEIHDGRHPVVEQMLKDSLFVPNDTFMGEKEDRVAIITGPNMAGKSTYMRQVALIVLMAQMGSFVPATSARIGVVDRIFTRIGASDDLSAGQSTFMVEMTEVADILRHATKHSLLILDEIGRGTSTFDGMSIARAVLEYCADKKLLGAKTLFATHYHELTELENTLPGTVNYNIAVKTRGEDIIFLRKIVPGGADRSYGIEVAKLAGLPDKVIQRAKAVLQELEEENGVQYVAPRKETDQVSLDALGEGEVLDAIRRCQVETLTPLEAMNLIYGWKQKLN